MQLKSIQNSIPNGTKKNKGSKLSRASIYSGIKDFITEVVEEAGHVLTAWPPINLVERTITMTMVMLMGLFV